MSLIAIALLCTAALQSTYAACPTLPLQVRIAAFDDWYGVVSDIYMMGHQDSRNNLLASDKIVSTAADRLMNFTLMAPAMSSASIFKIVNYSGKNTGFMASLYYNGQLITQTGQSGWNITLVDPWIDGPASTYSYVPTPDWAPAMSCSVPPATVNAFNQTYTEFMTKYNASAPQPQWIAPNGNCNNATAPLTYWVRVTYSLTTVLPTCPYTFNDPYLMGINRWFQWVEYRVGTQTGPKALQVRTTGELNYVAYVGNYTVVSEADDMIPYVATRVTDYKVQVNTAPQVFAVALNEYNPSTGGRGFIASIMYDNQLVASTGDLTGWKVTSNTSLLRPGWNWDYNYDTTGWDNAVAAMVCPDQIATFAFVQPYVAELGMCAQLVGYPNCSAIATKTYYRYAFDPASFAPKPRTLCQDTTVTSCSAGKYAISNRFCADCPLSTYKYSTGNGACTDCPATMSTNTTGSTTCTCSPGYGWTGSVCNACTANTFKVANSNSTCTSCLTAAYASCTATTFTCSTGYTVSADGQSCVQCAAGTYKAATGNAQCTSCTSGSTTVSTGSTYSGSCQCLAGYGWDGVACNSCLLTSSYKAIQGNTACVSCPANSTCTATSFTCIAGYTLSADTLSCVPCSMGTYKSGSGNGACTACPTGSITVTNGSTQASSCFCPAGYGWDGTICVPCAAGTFKRSMGNMACTACPAASSCIPTAFQCYAGYGLSANGLSCDICPIGTYKQGINNVQCSACAAGATTVSNGTTSLTGCQCAAGYAWDGSQCTQCAIGSYKDIMGNFGCANCTDMSTTIAVGGASADSCLCLPGYEWDGFVCTKCQGSKFKKDYGNSACVTCPRNAICTPTLLSCAAGYTPSADGWLCVQCASGTYKDSVGIGKCIPCPDGSTNAQCSASFNSDGSPVVLQTGQGEQNSVVSTASSGFTFSTSIIAIFSSATLIFFIVAGIVVVKLYPKFTSKESGLPSANISTKPAMADDFSSRTTLQASTFYSKSYSGTQMGATTILVNNTEFAMPGFLQLQAGKDFRWETLLAKGGGGEVFTGRGFTPSLCQQNGGALAVKIIASSRSAVSLKSSQAFDQEIAVMHYLGRHRNIAQLLGWCEEPLAIVMKFYQLGTLTGFIKSGFLETKGQIVLFALDICKAVQYVHGKSVAHRDIKADNVFIDLDKDGAAVCVLGDFGIANIFSRQAQLVEGFQVVNLNGLTISYSAPEIIRRFRARDYNCGMEDAFYGDIYSTAMLLYLLQNKVDGWNV